MWVSAKVSAMQIVEATVDWAWQRSFRSMFALFVLLLFCMTHSSPGSRDLRVATLTRQNGMGNAAQVSLHQRGE